jgi:glutaryl-CoA dehydrogenase
MAREINKGFLLVLHLGRKKNDGTLQAEQISGGKLNKCCKAIKIALEARTIPGGNGITVDYSSLHHANNSDSARTYEGTDEIHTLIRTASSPASPASVNRGARRRTREPYRAGGQTRMLRRG